MISAMVLTLASALDPSRLPDGTDPWAVGYAMTVVRNCPGWTMDAPEQLHRKGILPKAAFGSPEWRTVEDGVRTGIAAAETTRSGHPDMCDDLPTIDNARWKRLRQILKRPPTQAPPHR